MITPAALGFWLRTDPIEHSQAMIELLAAGDLLVLSDGDTFTVMRAHGDGISRLETGSRLPLLPAALA